MVTEISYKDLLDFHKKKNSKFNIVTKIYEVEIPFGVIKIKNNKLKEILEKPKSYEHINAGIYCINNSILKEIKFGNKLDMNTLLNKIKIAHSVLIYPIHEYWKDLGNLNTYKELNHKR